MAVRVRVADLVIDPKTKAPVVILETEGGTHRLPIFIGLMEASAIAAAREGIILPRPMTHDLLAAVLETTDASLERVEVTELRENTFFAVLELRIAGVCRTVDSRPSDAIAVALRTRSPIYVDEAVIEAAGVAVVEKDKWLEFLENLDPDDFGDYKM